MESFTVTFKLKCEAIGSNTPIIIGDHPALGSGNPELGITLYPSNSPYNYTASVIFDSPITEDFTYNYAIRTQFGTVVNESTSPRILPHFTSSGHIFDVLNVPNSIYSVVLHFRVRVNTQYGQEVFLTGSIPELGNWSETAALPLFFEGNKDFWSTQVVIPLSDKKRTIEYKYLVSRTGSIDHWEPEENHKLELDSTPSPCAIEVLDEYRWPDPVLDAFTRATFTQVVNRRVDPEMPDIMQPDKVLPYQIMLYFQVHCPFVRSNQKVLVVGSIPELGKWNPKKGLVLKDGLFPFWRGCISLKASNFPFEYKFVLADDEENTIWEDCENRVCDCPTLIGVDKSVPCTYFINSWFTCPNKDLFKGLGIYVPIFSLRTKNSQGIGSYTDVKMLVDCCNKMGASMIQLLPINDTTDKGEWGDSYPYKQVSCFALHPVYIDLLNIKEDLPEDIKAEIEESKKVLEALPSVDYPSVYAFKQRILKKIFVLEKDRFENSTELTTFLKKNEIWLKPYALFLMYKDENHTMEFRKWKEHSTITPEEIEYLCEENKDRLLFTYWTQYVADCQFKEIYNYASEHNVALKGDLPIGVNINSVECWAFPNLFRLNMCAGAPPDDFSADGQNWGFPTYDWEEMEKDGFAWWRSRLQRMAELYHTLRVDHILGFFRIWEIPRDTCIRGLLGHFYPCNPLTRKELEDMKLWDIDRYVKPYVRDHLLKEKFGSEAEDIAKKYFIAREENEDDDFYDFKEEYNNERKIHDALIADKTLTDEERNTLQTHLFELISNVLLIEDTERKDCFHVRTEIKKERVELTKNGPIIHYNPSWNELDSGLKRKFEDLYNDFTYRRQTGLWVSKARAKLNILKTSTKMLICGEDLGQITEGIIKCLEETGLLSLRVQRMSKDPAFDFDDFNQFKYLSVACPSTHDTSSLRGWWEENTAVTNKFWYNVLSRHEACPRELSASFQEIIVRQNLWSNSMWAIFLLQDLTGICNSLRLQTPDEERINIPSDPNHKWRYRYPFTLEELATNNEFNTRMRAIVESSNRI